MNVFKAFYCRAYQTILHIAQPLLPYRNPERIDSVDGLPDVIKSNGKSRPLIVTDKTIVKLTATTAIIDALTSNGVTPTVYSDTVANPTTDNVADALRLYNEGNCDCIIAIGGGSAMDCAKAVGARIARPDKELNKLKGILKVHKKIPLLIAIPTTAGTGSETTLAAVIVDSQTRHKYAINDFPLIPSYAVLDARMTETVPPRIAATTGMDALTHAVEAYIGNGNTPQTRTDASFSAWQIIKHLPTAVHSPDEQSRKKMLNAAHTAGKAFTRAYVGYVHAIAHALGGKYDIPHGLANAIILPIVLREYGKSVEKKLYELALSCQIVDNTATPHYAANAFIERIKSLNEQFDIPSKIDAIKSEDIHELAITAEKEANPLYPVPQLWTVKKFESVITKIMLGTQEYDVIPESKEQASTTANATSESVDGNND